MLQPLQDSVGLPAPAPAPGLTHHLHITQALHEGSFPSAADFMQGALDHRVAHAGQV